MLGGVINVEQLLPPPPCLEQLSLPLYLLIPDAFMKSVMDQREFMANQSSQINYAEFYKQYLSSLYQISARLRAESVFSSGLSPSSPDLKKGHELWSPAKLVEMESSESGEEVGSGKPSHDVINMNTMACKSFSPVFLHPPMFPIKATCGTVILRTWR